MKTYVDVEVEFSDEVLAAVEKAAKAAGVSAERFVVDAIYSHLLEEKEQEIKELRQRVATHLKALRAYRRKK